MSAPAGAPYTQLFALVPTVRNSRGNAKNTFSSRPMTSCGTSAPQLAQPLHNLLHQQLRRGAPAVTPTAVCRRTTPAACHPGHPPDSPGYPRGPRARAADWSWSWSASRRPQAHRTFPAASSPHPGDSGWRSRCLPCAAWRAAGSAARRAATISLVSSTDSVV